MVDVLVIPDGAAQPPRDGSETALEAAWTPVLDELAGDGAVVRVATTPPGCAPGSEIGITSLLGAPPAGPVGRGWVDAAAHAIAIPDGMTPWRADLVYRNGRRASVRQARDVCVHLGPDAHAIGGHRIVLLGATRPPDRRLLGLWLRVWEDAPPPGGRVPCPTTVVAARGAAAGCARLLGAQLVVPPGATGDVDTDLAAKARAAQAAIRDGARRVVVHVGGPDEAAHRRDASAVAAILERLDRELLAPLRHTVGEAGGRLVVCPDHGTDPQTGAHDGAPVPAVVWGAGVAPAGPDVLHERAARAADLLDPRELLPLAAEAPA